MTDNKLNEALATRLFGWKRGPAPSSDGSKWAMVGCTCHHTPDFLHDWAAMGSLVAAMGTRTLASELGGWSFRLIVDQGRKPWAVFWRGFPYHHGEAFGDSMPEAVARAAAAAMGIVD